MNEWTVENMVEVRLSQPDDFLKIRETLSRMGIASKKDKKLFQSCHILHKQGRYFIVHFKELFALDGLPSNLSESDISRRNMIASLLEEWGLLEIVDPTKAEDKVPINHIKIIPHREKNEWELIPKYHIGKRK